MFKFSSQAGPAKNLCLLNHGLSLWRKLPSSLYPCSLQLFMNFSFHPWSPFLTLQSFPTLSQTTVFLAHCVCIHHSLRYPPSFPGGWIDCVFVSCGGHGVKQMCWGEWQNNQLSFLTVPNELHRSHGQEAISPFLPHLWTQLVPSLPPSVFSLHFSFPGSAPPPFTWSHFTSSSTAWCCIITNLQIMSPLSLPFSLNNLSKTSWVTFASECCQSRFPPSLLKRPREDALRSNDSVDWADQMWTHTLGTSFYCAICVSPPIFECLERFHNSCFLS